MNLEYTDDMRFWVPTVGDGEEHPHQRVRRVRGSYTFPSWLIGIVRKTDGSELLVCETDAPGNEGMVHVFGASVMEPVPLPDDARS